MPDCDENATFLAKTLSAAKNLLDKPIRRIELSRKLRLPCVRVGGLAAMRGRVGLWLLVACIPFLGTNAADADCVNPMQLVQSTARIARYVDGGERATRDDIASIRGTAWFLSPTSIVTAEHVVAAMMLSPQDWKTLDIESGNVSRSVKARIRRKAGAEPEMLAVIELQDPIEGVRSVTIRREPLLPEEQVITITYPSGRSHPVAGRFVRLGETGKLAGMALLEFYEGENRLIIDHGASGAPVLDCGGRVAAVVTNVITQSIQFASREIRFSTGWGTPNVVSVPLHALDDLSQVN